MKKISLLIVLTLFFAQSIFAQEDKPGSKDHPLLSRFEGSGLVVTM